MFSGIIVASLLSVSPRPDGGLERWDFVDEPRPRPARVEAPTAFMFDRAIEDMQGALGEWQKERREFNHDVDALEQIRERRAAPKDEQAVDSAEGAAPMAGSATDSTSGKKPAHGGSKMKVIEVAPPPPNDAQGDDAATTAEPPKDDATVDSEMLKLDAELQDRERRCQEDPARCAKEKEQRRIVREGNRAWDEAIEQKERAREEAIEAQARKIQAELDAAKRREAEERAKKMGGSIDANGNFVDQDLDSETRDERH